MQKLLLTTSFSVGILGIKNVALLQVSIPSIFKRQDEPQEEIQNEDFAIVGCIGDRVVFSGPMCGHPV